MTTKSDLSAEVICKWMKSDDFNKPFTLDQLHQVEERLTSDQQDHYSKALSLLIYPPSDPSAFYRSELFMFFHATPAQKIKALAEILCAKVD